MARKYKAAVNKIPVNIFNLKKYSIKIPAIKHKGERTREIILVFFFISLYVCWQYCLYNFLVNMNLLLYKTFANLITCFRLFPYICFLFLNCINFFRSAVIHEFLHIISTSVSMTNSKKTSKWSMYLTNTCSIIIFSII